ncbi:hypothetical protein EJ08DRAFT_420091 [Tothia fuscella]|uniref:Uncharacterized protein n=1 Tax=Tothia fuscella TaxID=1048955 RepID=A0A9P4NJX5_9PEZI|nr:hypothetical protein EJ08DRAFT_420091 [Tothia fuscella]
MDGRKISHAQSVLYQYDHAHIFTRILQYNDSRMKSERQSGCSAPFVYAYCMYEVLILGLQRLYEYFSP